MAILASSIPNPAFDEQRELGRPRRVRLRQNTESSSRKRLEGTESSEHQRAANRLIASRGGVSDLVAIIENKRRAWSAAQLAELLGCSAKHIYEPAKSRRMPHLRIGGMIRFDLGITGACRSEHPQLSERGIREFPEKYQSSAFTLTSGSFHVGMSSSPIPVLRNPL